MPPMLSRAARAGAMLCSLSLAVACADGVQAPTAPTPAEPSLAKGGPNALPTRGLIVLSSELTGDSELYTVEEDGSNLRRLTYHTGRDVQPDWSTDGRRIAFIRETQNQVDIWTINADGSGAKRVTSFAATYGTLESPRWSPDGKRIAFHYMNAENNYDVYTIGSNGKGLARLTTAPSFQAQPSWSPDGRRIAYITSEPGMPLRVESMLADGTDPQPLGNCQSMDGCRTPRYSPDGTTVLVSEDGGIYRYNLANNLRTTITTDGFSPAWSPDGTHVAYTSYSAPAELRVVGASGGAHATISMPNAAVGSGISWKR